MGVAPPGPSSTVWSEPASATGDGEGLAIYELALRSSNLGIGGNGSDTVEITVVVAIPTVVGGTTSFLTVSSISAMAALVVAATGAFAILAVGGWYARRRISKGTG